MSETELPITGYLDRFSHRPGESFTAYVSVRDGGTYRARLVRVLSGDPNPDGPGVRFEDLSRRFDQSFAGRRQAIHCGSYGIVDAGPARDGGVRLHLDRAGASRRRATASQALLAEETGDAGVALLIGATGATARITVGRRRVAARDRDRHAGGALVSRVARDRSGHRARRWSASSRWTARRSWPKPRPPALALPSGGTVLLAAARRGGTARPFHRQARGSRHPERLRRVLARCRRITAARCLVTCWPAGISRSGIDTPGDPRHRPAGVPRHGW